MKTSPIQASASTSPWVAFQIDIVRCCWALLPPAFLWGASFPLALAAAAPIMPEIEEYPLEEANRALTELKERNIRGAKVLKIG